MLLLSLFLAFSSCQSDTAHISPAFYHWKSAFAPAPSELSALKKLHVNRIYLRYFDLKYSPEKGIVYPEAIVNFPTASPISQEIVPTIYITNRAILKTPVADIDSLAQKLLQFLFQVHAQAPPTPLHEVQIDCDWTSRTRDRYFQLLETVRHNLAQRGIQLSATIRLHQLKFRRKTGIPPVDRGMLMFYNMGDIGKPDTENSILDLDIGRSYFNEFTPYPIPLDAALPLFSWGVLIRQGQPIRLLNNLFPDQIESEANFKKVAPNRIEVSKNRYFRGEYLYEGDVIRLETVEAAELQKAAELLAETLPQDSMHVSLYHLDSLTLQHYELETLAAVFDAFRR